jgi:hypothetical protein
MKNAVFWDVTPCGSCKNRHLGGTNRCLHQGEKNKRAKNNLAVTTEALRRNSIASYWYRS